MQVRRARGSILAALLGLAVLPAALPLGLPVGPQAVDVVVDISGAAGTLLVVRHARNRARHRRHDRAAPVPPSWLVGRRHHRGERRRRRADPGSGRHASSPGHRRRCRPRLDARDRRHDPRSRCRPPDAVLCGSTQPLVSRPTTRSRAAGRVGRVALIKVDAEPARGRVRRLAARAHRPALPALRRRRPARRVDGRGQPSGARRARVPPGDARPRRRAAGRRTTRSWRIYSMTKPITSVAAMMLYEEGALELTDPVARFIPSFADAARLQAGPALNPVDGPGRRARPHLAPAHPHRPGSPTASTTRTRSTRCTACTASTSPVRRASDLATACDLLAELPLLFQPGTEWNYGVSTDVLGRVVEVASGQPFDAFLAEHILGPAGHGRDRVVGRRARTSTGWPTLYMRGPDGGLAANTAARRGGDPPDRCCTPAGAGWCRRWGTTTASPRCCCAAVSSTASGCSARAPSPS